MSRWTNQQRDAIIAHMSRALDILHICDIIAVSENDGGLLANLYNSKKKFRLCAVYEENEYTNWKSLPIRVREKISELEVYGGNFPGKLSDAQRGPSSNYLCAIDPFEFTRTAVRDGEDVRYYYGSTIRSDLALEVYARDSHPSSMPSPPIQQQPVELLDVLTFQLKRVYPNAIQRKKVQSAVEEKVGPTSSLPPEKVKTWIEKLVAMDPRNG